MSQVSLIEGVLFNTMQNKVVVLGIVFLLFSSVGAVGSPTKDEISEDNWWDVYSRDKNHDGISDFLIWKLQQGDRFFDAGEARVFVSFITINRTEIALTIYQWVT